jgi:hypothetical protein
LVEYEQFGATLPASDDRTEREAHAALTTDVSGRVIDSPRPRSMSHFLAIFS